MNVKPDLLGIPAEIRLEILKLVFTPAAPFVDLRLQIGSAKLPDHLLCERRGVNDHHHAPTHTNISVLSTCRQLYAEARTVIHGSRTFIFQNQYVLRRLNQTELSTSQKLLLQGMRHVTFRVPCDILSPADHGSSNFTVPRSPEDVMGDIIFLLKQWRALLKSNTAGISDDQMKEIQYELDFSNVPFALLDIVGWERFKAVILGMLLVFLRYEIDTGSNPKLSYVNLSPEFQEQMGSFQQTGRLACTGNAPASTGPTHATGTNVGVSTHYAHDTAISGEGSADTLPSYCADKKEMGLNQHYW